MIKLTIGNSYSRLEGLSRAQFEEIRKLTCFQKRDASSLKFQYKTLVARYGKTPSLKQRHHLKLMRQRLQAALRPIHLTDKKGNFPSGLLSRVKQWLKSHKFELIDNRKRPEPVIGRFIMSMSIAPYALQTKAVEACLRTDRGIISATTGFGKSLMIGMLVNRLQLKTLIVVPNIGLKTQLRESLKEWFGDTGGNIVVENIDSSKLKELIDFDLLIIDEAHHAAAATYRTLNKTAWKNIYYRFCFTATPFRSRTEETILMESITSKILYKITYKDALSVGAVVPVEAYYVDVPISEDVDGVTWAEVYSELIVNNEKRNNQIKRLLKSLWSNGDFTLCLVKEIKHGKMLSEIGLPFINGGDQDSRIWLDLFNQRKAPVLIATTGMCGEGVDTKSCEYVIIGCLGKSKNALMQWIGRSLRRFPGKDSAKIIIFRDKSHKWTISHFNIQCRVIMEEYGVKPVKLCGI